MTKRQDLDLHVVLDELRKNSEKDLKNNLEQEAQSREIDREKRRAEKLKNDELEKRIEEAGQRIEQRKGFHRFAMIIISIPVVVSAVGFMILVCFRREGDDMALISSAFFASVVAEVIGLSYIMGNYFYPRRGESGD